MQPVVYILASQARGTLYIDVTSNLIQRVWQHKNHVVQGFTHKYGVDKLVWYEQHATMEAAITREKQLKAWKRDWKIRLVETRNPDWLDWYGALYGA